MSKSILAIGGIYVDINCHGVAFKGAMYPEVEMDGAEYEVVAGGSGVNFGRLCKQLGMDPAFIGKIGDDRMGDFVEQLMKDAGIRPLLVRDDSVTTQIGISFVNDLAETIMPGAGNANKALGPGDVIHELKAHAANVDYLYLGTCLKLSRLLPAYPEIAEIARGNNARIIVDHGRVTHLITKEDIAEVKELVKKADLYFPSKDEFLEVWECSSIEEGLRKLETLTNARTVVKDGKNGAYSIEDGVIMHAEAHPVQARYMVGAGDSFNAGFIAAHAQGKDLQGCMDYACAVAALKVSGQPITAGNISKYYAG